MMSRNPDILFITEYIKNVLYFATVRQGKVLKSTPEIHYFCIDNELVYENYYSDFGPLNLGCVYKYCMTLNEKVKLYLNKQSIVHYTSIDPKRKANAAFLLGCYGVLYLNLSPKEALKPLTIHGQTYRPFQDATQGDSMYTITLMDCLHSIRKAREVGFFDFQDFNYEEYERLDKIQGGDLNWIVPGKFLAFIGPVDYSVSLYHPPEMYIDYFVENNVKIVIRLNKRMYDGNVFGNVGILHYDLFFPDGSCPPRHILFKFLQISEEADGAIAVHCKAGLGRTGSLIGCYLIKHYRMSAHEAIGWMRICRPGSVIGHQQSWLEQLEPWLIKQGNLYRKRTFQDTEKFPIHEYGVYSIAERMQNQKPVVFSKLPSPPPPIQRQTRSEITAPLRPQASKLREAPNKMNAIEKEQCEWHMKSPKLHVNAKVPARTPSPPALLMVSKELQEAPHSTGSRRTFAAGEPRTTTRPMPRSPSKSSHTNRLQTHRAREKSTEGQHPYQTTNTRNINVYPQVLPIPTYTTSQGPAIKTLTDARNFLMRTSIYKDQKDKQLNSTVTVTPQYQTPVHLQNTDRHTGVPNTPSIFSTISRSPTQPVHRRRLGRSPSPSPSPSPTRGSDHSRATNTVHVDKYLQRDSSKSALREALSKLRLSSGRDGSVGAASVGAASLGARREAPAGVRAPSVRSDERPLATQGDLLNSIKFQRRYRDTLYSNKNLAFMNSSKTTSPFMNSSKTTAAFMTPSKTTAAFMTPSKTTAAFMTPSKTTAAFMNASKTNAVHKKSSKTNATFMDNTPRPTPLVGLAGSRTSALFGYGHEKTTSSSSKAFFNPSRPTSPKGRTRQPAQVTQHYFY